LSSNTLSSANLSTRRSALLRFLLSLLHRQDVPDETKLPPADVFPSSVDVGHQTHAGLRRRQNQDTYGAYPERRFWLVADGMGGHAHGELASSIARDVVLRSMDNGETLTRAILNAHDCIVFAASMQSGRSTGMGTTIAALHWDAESSAEVAWVGDSRVYMLRNGSMRQLTRDHSLIQRWVDAGIVAPEDAKHHTMRNVLTQALGLTDIKNLEVETRRVGLSRGNRILLCSDGLTGELSDAEIEAMLGRQDLSAQECADALIKAALACGGSDNITAIVISFS
jgi:PPM family protein phosphatase